MEVCVLDTCLSHAPLEQVLVGSRLVGVAVLLTEHVPIRVVGRVLFFEGELNVHVLLEVFIEAVGHVDRSAGAGGLGAFHCFDTGGCLDGVVEVGKAISRLADPY